MTVKSLDDTLKIIRGAFHPLTPGEPETVPLHMAAGRVLALDITAREDNPPFNRSSLDGYAIRAADTFGAGESIPAMLTPSGEVLINKIPQISLLPGHSMYIPTGGCLPEGADAVAMIEIAEVFGGNVLVLSQVAPGTGIVFRGEDTKAGETVIREGEVLSSRHIGALAALGYGTVPVRKRLICAVISTGNELLPIESPLVDGATRDVNSHLLRSQLEAFGCEARVFDICPDDETALSAVVRDACELCDVVLVSGGSSVGVMDLTKRVFQQTAEILVHGIAVKPGKPTIIAKAEDKALIGLPGHPVSAFFVMLEVVRPLINSLRGLTDAPQPTVTAKLADKVPSNHGREDLIPISLNTQDMTAHAVPYKSGLITLLTRSDGYIRVPRFTEGLDKGAEVQVLRYI
ncbi:MAG: molybdopterin-binding protein [Oscillospiraceae bacterium]|nr:molybdopterin-binding protein [Oscillospiraceae bacterium]